MSNKRMLKKNAEERDDSQTLNANSQLFDSKSYGIWKIPRFLKFF